MLKYLIATALILPVAGSSRFASPKVPILDVPLIRQSTEYSCGAAALLAVLAYYGNVDYNESDIMKMAKTTLELGTDERDMVRVSNDLGLRAHFAQNSTLEDVKQSLARKHPVILDVQAWPLQTPREPWEKVWTEGHYVVAVGMDDQYLYFMDPSHLGSRGYWTHKEFESRWHDWSRDDVELHHPAIYFDGIPNPPTAWLPTP